MYDIGVSRSGAASVGVKKVENLEELRSTYEARHQELGSLVVASGNIVKAQAGRRLGAGFGSEFLGPNRRKRHGASLGCASGRPCSMEQELDL